MSQLFNTGLLLGQQLFAQHLWLRWRQAVIKRAGAAQMSDMCSADHDLGRHATDVDAGSTDGTALDQRHPSALLNGFQCRRHRRSTTTDDCDMQAAIVAGLVIVESLYPDRKSTRMNSSH